MKIPWAPLSSHKSSLVHPSDRDIERALLLSSTPLSSLAYESLIIIPLEERVIKMSQFGGSFN